MSGLFSFPNPVNEYAARATAGLVAVDGTPAGVIGISERVKATTPAALAHTRQPQAALRLAAGDLELDRTGHRVRRAGEELHLGPTEFRLLSTLMERPGRVWTREQLLDRVWGRDIYVDTRTIDVHVGRLRKALMAYGGDNPVRTVRGTGYALG